MALPLLVNGADCGPVNPLQGLTKRLDQDRGIQQDHFGAGRAGSSREVFRTQYNVAPGINEESARFFSNQSAGPSTLNTSAYDLSALHQHLPSAHVQAPVQSPPVTAPNAAWAADFMQQQPIQNSMSGEFLAHANSQIQATPEIHAAVQSSQPSTIAQGLTQWSPGPMMFANRMGAMPFQPYNTMQQSSQSSSQVNQSAWEQAFQSHEALSGTAPAVQEAQSVHEVAQPKVNDPDDLARAAGALIDAVQHEQNPKFKQSQFLGLMQQLRDGEVVVKGNEMIANDGESSSASNWASSFQSSIDGKGKGRAVDPVTTNTESRRLAAMEASRQIPQVVSMEQVAEGTASSKTANLSAEEEIDAYFRSDNDDYINYWHTQDPQGERSYLQSPQATEWDRLQRDWDRFEATTTGIRPIANYQFQANNPYLLGERTRHHTLHAEGVSSLFENVLEMEAAVQRDPRNARAWFELGVKQQENEREQMAIQALRRALELDSSHLPSWLALAISHTNEGNRPGTYEAVRQWVERNERYQTAVRNYYATHPENDEMTQTEKFSSLIECLITMARSDATGDIDPDLQIALAVLMNTNEAYDKAKDCFSTALALRPDDWQLYNRVGATLANSGNPEEALQYYHRALELNPAYIRAKFNLGISCINLRRYQEASEHILDALVLQDSDSVHDSASADKRGVTSSALWDSLKTCCVHMQRLDLATICDRQDLDAFRFNAQIL